MQVRIGPGLQQAGGRIVADRAGVVRAAPGGKLWLDARQKRWGLSQSCMSEQSWSPKATLPGWCARRRAASCGWMPDSSGGAYHSPASRQILIPNGDVAGVVHAAPGGKLWLDAWQ